MKRVPKVTYQTVAELELRIKAREADAASLPAGEPRQSVLKEIARLRTYASVKQWLSEPLPKSAAADSWLATVGASVRIRAPCLILKAAVCLQPAHANDVSPPNSLGP